MLTPPGPLLAGADSTWLNVLWSWAHVQVWHAGTINSSVICAEVYCYVIIACIHAPTKSQKRAE